MKVTNPYDYNPGKHCAVLPTGANGTYRKLAVNFPSAVTVQGSKPADVLGTCYLPQKVEKAPLVVLVHGVGDTSAVPCHALARALATIGIASFIIYLPIHSRRLPAEMKARFYRLSIEEWFELYRHSVINIRQAIDWVESRPEIDASRLGVAGISFGAYVSAIALGIDPRLKAGALLLTSGNLEKLSWTRSTRRFERYDVSAEVFNEGQRRYLAYVDEVSERGFDQVPRPLPGYAFDPYTFSATLGKKDVLLVNALWDEYFPREAAKEFGQACGGPRQVWLPAGHASAWLFYPVIRHHVVDLFRKSLLAKAEV